MNPSLPSLAIGGNVVRIITSYLSLQGRVPLEKLIIHQLLKKLSHIMETGGPILHSHQSTICSYHETAPNPHIPSPCFKVRVKYCAQFLPRSASYAVTVIGLHQIYYVMLWDLMAVNGRAAITHQ